MSKSKQEKPKAVENIPSCLDEVDRLTAKSAYLLRQSLQNAVVAIDGNIKSNQLEIELLKRQKPETEEQLKAAEETLQKVMADIRKKYGIEDKAANIDVDTGNITFK